MIHQMHGWAHKTMKIYAKSTLRDAEDTEKWISKKWFCLVPATGPSQLNSCGARIVRMGGGRQNVHFSKKSCHIYPQAVV